MIEFQMSNVSCGGCAARITKAVKAVDEQAKVQVDLSAKKVRIASDLPAAGFEQALAEAGYPPVQVRA